MDGQIDRRTRYENASKKNEYEGESRKRRARQRERQTERQIDRRSKSSKKQQVEQSSDNRCVLWRTARVLVFASSFKWHTFLFLMLFCSNLAHFSEIQLVCDGRTDGPTDGPTDTVTYRVAFTRLKTDLRHNYHKFPS